MSTELDPAEFVERIRQLGEQRDQQDAERVRKLEEEIIQGRSERLARRAERARSLSPDKPSTPQQQTPRTSVHDTTTTDSPSHHDDKPAAATPTPTLTPKMDPPSRQSAHEASLQRLTGSPAAPQTLEDVEPKKPATSAAALGRSGTLSWQRRPQSGIGSVRRPLSSGRPLSGSVSESRDSNAGVSTTQSAEPQAPSSPAAPALSRSQIAESLGSKDPTWFKQTADRGVGSAAYRRSQEDGASDAASAAAKRQLPGMVSRESTADADVASPPLESSRSVSPSRASSVRGSVALSNRFSTNTSVSGGAPESPTKLGSPFQLSDSQKFAPPSEHPPTDGGDQPASVRSLAMSPTQGRISPERTDRPASPTKGMGGFVQSAMLKRSDSVSKRWSTHSPQASVSRHNSTISNRNSIALGPHGSLAKPDRPSSLSRDNSVEPFARPDSSASNVTMTKGILENETPVNTDASRPALSRHSRSKSVASALNEDGRFADDNTPPSPSKRWSPTKSTWLESALNKPESPKPKPAAPQQPPWMAEISRKKQERGSVDLGKGSPLQSPFDEQSGRKSPLKDVQLRPATLRKTASQPEEKLGDTVQPLSKSKTLPQQPAWKAELDRRKLERGNVDHGQASPLQSPTVKSPAKEIQPEPQSAVQTESVVVESAEPVQPPLPDPVLSPKPSVPVEEETKPIEEVANLDSSEEPKESDSPAPTALKTTTPVVAPLSKTPSTKAKPATPPKKDFRANLRSRQAAAASEGTKNDQISEFQNVFGRLKKAETKNYVAPDTLKDNILRGKTGLVVTGGPKPSVRRDELKESLVTKKAAILAKAQETGSAALKRPESPSKPPTTPEALAKRKALGRSDSVSKVPPPKGPEPVVVPEALARRKSLRASRPGSVSEPKGSSATASTAKETARPDGMGKVGSSDNTEPAIVPEALARRKSLRASRAESISEPKGPSVTSGPLNGPLKSSKLADRFNPALAGILARGPPAASGPSSAPDSNTGVSSPNATESKASGPGPELTHMTKGRARGPKRRAPGTKQAATRKADATPPKAESLENELQTSPSSLETANAKTSEITEVTSARETSPAQPLTSKPSTPIKSPRLSGKFEQSQSPEVPRKHPSLELQRKPSADVAKPAETVSPLASRKSLTSELHRKFSWETKEATQEPASFSSSENRQEPSLVESRDTGSTETVEAPKESTPLSSPEVPRKSPALELQSRLSNEGTGHPQPNWHAEIQKPNKPTTPPKTASWRASRPLPATPAKTEEAQKEAPSPLQEIPAPNGDKSPSKEMGTPSRFSVKSATVLWGNKSASPPPAALKVKSPVKLPTKADEQRAAEDAGLIRHDEPTQTPPKPQAPKSKPAGLGLGSLSGLSSFGGFVGARSRESSPPKMVPEKALPASPPATGSRPMSEPFEAPPKPGSPEELLAQFFDERPVTTGQLPEHIDTLQILKTTPLDLSPSGKVRTLRKQIQELTSDCKLQSVPSHQEHFLFQDSMYLCQHVFSDSKGARTTEVYLWCGNGVSESTVEDAQVFARNYAKQNYGKLAVLRQGKEIPSFFEALGGIVITKRASRATSNEYMLCGRRHLGHIAFDEVDFSPKALCSGFAYIVSTKTGKVFIWKGRGCSAEELSGARLISMDLNKLNGDLVEVDEGSEPQEFLDIFPPTTIAPALNKKTPVIPRSAAHWSYKATSERYRSRLFKVEQQQESSGWGQSLQTPITPRSPLPQTTIKVVEIMPFCQRDLEPEHIYVLDAFFEMYIIVGALSRAESAAFSAALLFAQDYSILAVSEEDRPLKPVTTIVLEGVPRDMKSVFRFWDDSLIPAAGLMRGKLGRGKSLRIMGLEKAIEATRR